MTACYEGGSLRGRRSAGIEARSGRGRFGPLPSSCWGGPMMGRCEGVLSGGGLGSRRRFAGGRSVTARYAGLFSLRSVFSARIAGRGAFLSGLVRVMSFCRRRVVMGRCGGFLSGFGRLARSGTSSCGRRAVRAGYAGFPFGGGCLYASGARSGRGWLGFSAPFCREAGDDGAG